MALKSFDFEVAPAGTTLTTANTGASQVVPNTGTATSSTVFVKNGSYGARFVSGSAALCIARLTPQAASTTMSFGYPFSIDAAPLTSGTPTWVATVRNSGGAAMRVQWTFQNNLEILDAAGANPVTLGTGLTPGNGYWFSVGMIVATSTTGTYTARLYDNAGTLLNTVTSSTFNLGSTAIAAADVGVVNSNPAAGTAVNTDYVQFNNGSSQGIAPSIAYSGTGAKTAAGTATGTGTTAFTGVGATTGSGATSNASQAAFTGTGVVAGTGITSGVGQVAFTGTASTSAVGVLTVLSNATFNGSGFTSGSGSSSSDGSPAFTGTGSTTGSGSTSGVATIGYSGIGTTFGAGVTSSTGTAVFGSDGSASGEGATTATGLVSFAGVGAVNGEGTVIGTEAQPRRDITVTATLGVRLWAGQAAARNKQGTIGTRRWGGQLG